MKALVLGCGSIGLRHIAHLKKLGVASIEAADPNSLARDKVQAQFGVKVYPNPEEGLEARPQAVLVCTPAATHVPLVMKALQAGAHVFVEKPLSTTLEGIDSLIEKVQLDGRIVQVGYNLRYHPAMKAAKEILDSGRLGRILCADAQFGLYLKKWWPGRDYRDSYMTHEDLSGGLLLDASHEIDLLIWFLGKVEEVKAFGGKLSHLEIQGLDLIKILMRMESGALASLRLDCLGPTYTRGFTLVGEDTALRWDCTQGRADKSLGQLQVYDSTRDRFEEVPLQGNSEETFLGELRDFLTSISTGKPPAVGLEQGVEVLRVACAIRKAIENCSTCLT